MPTLSIESLIRGSVYHEDKRDRQTSSKSTFSSRDLHSSSYANQKSSHTHHGGEGKFSREKQGLPESKSTESNAEIAVLETPPPSYSDSLQAPLPASRPTLISRSPRTSSVQPILTSPRLRLPVIIPQNPRDGGFCRAYSPLLEECKVTQTAFFYFLDDFDRSAQASPYFSAVNVASIGSLNRPHSTAMVVTLAKKRMNTFLDHVNEEFFQPRGLFALIVTWRPDVNRTHETVNIEDPVFSSSSRALPFPKAAQLSFPLGDPTENMEPTCEPPMPNIYGPISPAYGRGAGIPRLAGPDPYGYCDPYGYGNSGIYNQGYGMGMGGMGRTGFGGMGRPGMMGMGGMGGMGRMGMGGMGMGMGGGMGGGPLGLVAGLIVDKMNSKSQSNQYHQGSPNAGYDPGYMARGLSTKESDSKAFKKDAIYLLIVDLPSDDELARFGASY